MRETKFAWALDIYLLVGAGILLAQVNTGTISGTVSDASGAIVPGAQVTVKNVDTGITRVVTTSEGGRYIAPELTLGRYEVTATAQGFQTEVRSGITLTVGQEAVVNFALKVGSVSESVVVTAEAPLVETTTAATSGLVDERTVHELPLNGRSFSDLMDLQPNVKNLASVGVTGAQAATRASNGFGQKFTVNGANTDQNLFIVDGLVVNDRTGVNPSSATGLLLGTDTIREFRLLTSNYSAEYGEVSGSVMTTVTRAGTNSLHGSAFEYLRNSALDSKQFFDPGSSPPPFKRSQFGFTLGGPIKKDKTFFFGSYEGLRQRLGTTTIMRVPTLAARTGVLPTGPCAAGCVVGPAAKSLLALYPVPNSTNFGDGTANFISAPSNPTTENYFLIRMDHTLSQKHFLYGSYTFDQAKVSSTDPSQLFNTTKTNRYQHIALGLTSLVSATLLNSFRAGVNRVNTVQGFSAIGDVSPLTWSPGRYAGVLSVSPLTPNLAPPDPILLRWTAYQVGDDLNYTRGNHSIKFGGLLFRNDDNVDRFFVFPGTYTFNNLQQFFAQTPQTLLVANVGADPARSTRSWVGGAYVQDDWKALPRLTLNLGVRFEWAPPPSENYNRFSNLLHLSDPNVTVGKALPGDSPFQLGDALHHASPRLGLAWDPFGNSKTSIRAGVGIYDSLILNDYYSNAMDRMPPFYSTQLFSLTPTTPVLFPNALANFSQPGFAASLGRLDMVAPRLTQPYSVNWNFTIQQEVLPNTLLNVGYVGSRSIHQMRAWADYNQPISVVSPGGRVYIPQGSPRPNPNFTQVRVRDTNSDAYYEGLQISVQRRFSRGFQLSSSYTFSKCIDDNSLTISQGTDFIGNSDQEQYPFPSSANRGLCSWDQRHYWKTNSLYELPIGPDKALGGGLHGVAGKLAGGWSFSSILSLASGPPFTPVTSFDYQGALPQSGGAGHLDLVPGASLSPVLSNYRQAIAANHTAPYFDVKAFVLPPLTPDCARPGATCTRLDFGNVARHTMIGPGLATWDLSILKSTHLTERTQLQFRGEFFNLLDRANFRLPNNTVFLSGGARNAAAGQITDVSTSARQIQFALKLIF